jgi:hypothetical protein
MNFDKFMSLIENECLFFCRADKYDDKWEGKFPKKMIEKFELDKKEFPSEDGSKFSHCDWQIKKEARSHLINCWHANDNESFAMWKIYAENNIAIQSTLGRLKECFNVNSERIWIGDVEYINFREWEPKNRFFNGDVPNTLKTFFMKWHYFTYENEIRAIINKAFDEHQAEKGISVKVNICKLIESIYLSPGCKKEDEEHIDTILKEKNFYSLKKKSDLGESLYM